MSKSVSQSDYRKPFLADHRSKRSEPCTRSTKRIQWPLLPRSPRPCLIHGLRHISRICWYLLEKMLHVSPSHTHAGRYPRKVRGFLSLSLHHGRNGREAGSGASSREADPAQAFGRPARREHGRPAVTRARQADRDASSMPGDDASSRAGDGASSTAGSGGSAGLAAARACMRLAAMRSQVKRAAMRSRGRLAAAQAREAGGGPTSDVHRCACRDGRHGLLAGVLGEGHSS
jgi:hypothetical protein